MSADRPWSLARWCVGAHSREVRAGHGPFDASVARLGAPRVFRGAGAALGEASSWRLATLTARAGDVAVPLVPLRDGVVDYAGDARGMARVPGRLDAYVGATLAGGTERHFLTVDPYEAFPEMAREIRRYPCCDAAPWRDTQLTAAPAGTLTPVHLELAHNLFTVIDGEKEVALFAPRQTWRVYPDAPWSVSPHVARLPAVDLAPGTHQLARGLTAWRAVLRSGDVLYIPPRWWHAVRTVVPTLALAQWWAGGAVALVARAAVAYKRLRGLST